MKAMWNDEGGILEMDYFHDLFGYTNLAQDSSEMFASIAKMFAGAKDIILDSSKIKEGYCYHECNEGSLPKVPHQT